MKLGVLNESSKTAICHTNSVCVEMQIGGNQIFCMEFDPLLNIS